MCDCFIYWFLQVVLRSLFYPKFKKSLRAVRALEHGKRVIVINVCTNIAKKIKKEVFKRSYNSKFFPLAIFFAGQQLYLHK